VRPAQQGWAHDVARLRWLTHATGEEGRSLLERGDFFWLDLVRPPREYVDELAAVSGVDPEAVERALRFGEVPQLRLYRGHAQLVFWSGCSRSRACRSTCGSAPACCHRALISAPRRSRTGGAGGR
jgi:hypothetical protein